MKILILITLLMTLGACRNRRGVDRPEIKNQEQKSPVFKIVEIEGKSYIDMDQSFCNSRIYQINSDYIGSDGRVIRLDIMECQKIIGYSPGEYGVFATWLENMRHWLKGF